MGLRAFAKLRGCTLAAVQRAITEGRLSASVGHDARGRPVIRDVGLATEEWQTRSRPRLVNGHASNGRVATPSALAFQTMRERRARADHFEFETQRKKGEWVRTRDVEHRWAMIAVTTRTALLGIPSRARGRLPHLTALDVAVLDGLVRECLAELADTPPRDPAPRGPANASPSDAQEETP